MAEAPATVEDVTRLAREHRAAGRFDLVAKLLVTASRRALYDGWAQPEWPALAATLRDHQQFGYARRLLRRLHNADPTDRTLRQQYALCVYKDMELPAVRRLDRALDILRDGDDLETCVDAETLGLAGAVLKRRWEVEGRRSDLESARFCYERGYAQDGHPQQFYAGINAAFVLDQLATLDKQDALGEAPQAAELRKRAGVIRGELVDALQGRAGVDYWDTATLAEALFGLQRFEAAATALTALRTFDPPPWQVESTATQLGSLARLLHEGPASAAAFSESAAGEALRALVGDDESALRRAYLGKVGLALSGGGFRASLFHIGVLASLAERDLLRRVEALSCVSGGSIVGAYYYLKLRRLLNDRPDAEIEGQDYVELVREVADEFLEGVQQNLRVRLTEDLDDNFKMMATGYSRTNRAAELFEELIFSRVAKRDDEAEGPWRMTDLLIRPPGESSFSPRYDNWRRESKVPILVINATTLNSGHNWQFTATWMGEPPVVGDEQVDANSRLRRMYYPDAPEKHQHPYLRDAVAASACVPMLFPPLVLDGLFDGLSVELVDGGVHDNQGIASLLEQDCSVILVSDASGQMGDVARPGRSVLPVAMRSNSILMSRVRGAQYAELAGRRRSGALRRLMIVHLKKGLPVRPRDWSGCPEIYDPEQDEIPDAQHDRRAGYGMAEDVQRALAALRTDLDSFSNDEAYGLMAAGYRMTEYEFPLGLHDFPPPDRALRPARGWPFENALSMIEKPMAETSLGGVLEVGDKRFGRGAVAWWRRRKARPPGAIGRALTRTGLTRVPGTVAAGAAHAVATPARWIVSAPLALVGAAATRGWLGTFGRRRA